MSIKVRTHQEMAVEADSEFWALWKKTGALVTSLRGSTAKSIAIAFHGAMYHKALAEDRVRQDPLVSQMAAREQKHIYDHADLKEEQWARMRHVFNVTKMELDALYALVLKLKEEEEKDVIDKASEEHF